MLARLGLEQHPDKTFIGRLHDERGFDFLGIQFTDRGERSPSAVSQARHPEEVRKRLAQYPLEAREAIAHQIIPLGEITTDTLHYVTFLAKLPGGGQRFLCVIGTPDGPRVDWDAYARYGTANWADILAGKTKEATVRVSPSLSNYYVKEFSDRKKWISIALSSPDLEIPIYGYVARDSKLAQKVKSFGAKRAVLDIKMTQDQIKNRLVEISGIRASGWVQER